MTMPLANTALIGQRATTPVADRVSLLTQQQSWMPPDATVALAQSDHSDNELQTIADSIKSTLASTWDAFTEHVDDTVLHKQPSSALTLARFLHASIGPLPVRQDDLGTIQQNLQKAGFGHGLAVNGVWGPDWNTAYNDWADDLRTRQIAGEKPGSIRTAEAGHHWFDALLPTHAINAVVGAAKGIAHGVNTLLGDVAGDVVDVPYLLTGHTEQSRQANATRAWFQNIGQSGDKRVTPEEVARQDEFKRVAQDVLTMISLVPVAGEGSAALQTVRGAWAGGVSREFAQRTTGTVAKSFFGGRTEQMIAENAARRGPLNSRFMQNIPLLRQVGPAVGRLADHDGLYYRSRTLLASPYALPAVRAAGAEGQRLFLQGAALNVAADLAPHVGFDNDITRDIRDTNIFDEADTAVGRVFGNPDSHVFSHAVDSLGFVLHGPLGSTKTSTAVGDRVQEFTDGINEWIGHYGVEGSWQRAVSKATTGKHVPISDLHKAFGDQTLFERFMANKVADLAAAHYAQNTAQREGLTFGSVAFRDRTGQLADDVWNNPDLHQTAIKELLANKTELENRVAADMIHNRLHPSDYHEGMVDDLAGSGNVENYAANGIAWMNAGSHVQDMLKTGLARYLFGPDGRAVIHNAQDQIDFGGETPLAQRLTTTTRRDYVRQVTTTLTSVRRQIDKARTDLGRAVAKAETDLQNAVDDTARRSAQGRLTAAKKAQRTLEQALDDGKISKFTETVKRFGTRSTNREWGRLQHDISRLRVLVDQGTPEGERLTLTHLLENGVDPDELYSNINGLPRHDPTIGSGDWLREHLQHGNGVLGLARKDTKTAQQAVGDVRRFEARVDAAKTPEELAQVEAEMREYAFREFGMTERTLGLKDAEGLLPLLEDHANRLASEVFRTFDAPPELVSLMDRIDQQGYKLVLGSHIGHLWDHTLPAMPDLHGAIGRRRRVAGALGLDPTQVASRDAGRDATLRVTRHIDQLWDDPRFRPPPRVTAETIMQVLRDEHIVEPELRLPEHVATAITRPFHKRGIQQIEAEQGVPYEEAKAIYERGMAKTLQLRDLSRAKFIKALTTGKEGIGPNGPWQWAGMDKQSANLVRRAVLKGYAERPGYIQGLSTVEDWVRGGFSIGDSLAVRFAGDTALSELVQRAAELPNTLVNLRNRLRFTLSPYFDFRRVAKQNVKMSIDGVTPVLNPLAHMVENGTYNKAHRFLDRLLGEPEVHGYDDADRYLHQQSVWGLYNSRHFEAYYAWEKKAAGWSDDEIRQGIRRVFEYGSTRNEGRSALERTVNTVFFPFSFEKTLLRNVGAYMIDHPQQALLLTGAMTAYDEANKHSEVHQWVQDHLPILRDIEKLNAFAHGISPGEFGGINAPLMNLFLPQKWDGGLTKDNLRRFLPVWNDFGQLVKDLNEQRLIGQAAALNARDYALSLGAPRSALDPYRPMITRAAQQREALVKRNQFILALAPTLEHNAGTTDPTRKILWPDIDGFPTILRGQPIDRTTISRLIKIWYPHFDPSGGAHYAIESQDTLDYEIAGIAEENPTRGKEYQAFAKLADTVIGHLNRNDYDTPQASGLMVALRQISATLSETDPKFYRIYKEHWARAFGPLEEVS